MCWQARSRVKAGLLRWWSHGGTLALKNRAWVWMEPITKNGVKSHRKREGWKENYACDFLQREKETDAGLLKQQCHLLCTPIWKPSDFSCLLVHLQRCQQIWEPPCSTELRKAGWKPAFPPVLPVYLPVSTGFLKTYFWTIVARDIPFTDKINYYLIM